MIAINILHNKVDFISCKLNRYQQYAKYPQSEVQRAHNDTSYQKLITHKNI